MMRVVGLTSVVSVLSVAAWHAQTPPTFRSVAEGVAVHATVTTREGAPVRTLTRDDFEILDNGVRQPIVVFSDKAIPVSVAIVLDRSGSLSERAGDVTAAAEAFIEHLLPDDQASLHTLMTDCQAMTKDRAALRAAVGRALPTDSGSPIWAALGRTLPWLSRVPGRRAVLLVSDGDDTGPMPLLRAPHIRGRPLDGCRYAGLAWPMATTLGGVLSALERHDVLVYTISVSESFHLFGSDLGRVASRSGGRRYELSAHGDLVAAFTEIARELHHQYLLGFVPSRPDGTVHQLEVRVKKPGLVVRARRSYVAGGDSDGGHSRAASETTSGVPEPRSDQFRGSCQLPSLPALRNRKASKLRPLVEARSQAATVDVSVVLDMPASAQGATIWLESDEADPVVLLPAKTSTSGPRVTATFEAEMLRLMPGARTNAVVYSDRVRRRCALTPEFRIRTARS
jgi:VWFA-related protein